MLTSCIFSRRKCQSAFCARRDLCARARMICVPINCLSIIQHSWADQRWFDRFGQRFLSSIETRFPMVSSVQNLFVQRFWVFRLYWNISRSIADSLPGNYTPVHKQLMRAAPREISDLWTKNLANGRSYTTQPRDGGFKYICLPSHCCQTAMPIANGKSLDTAAW